MCVLGNFLGHETFIVFDGDSWIAKKHLFSVYPHDVIVVFAVSKRCVGFYF